jgi:hypothetical protein
MSLDALIAQATDLGRERGHAAATWAGVDASNVSTLSRQWADGDPALFDAMPGPLSGEWAGDPTPSSLLEEIGFAERPFESDPFGTDADEIMTAYENAYSEAYGAEFERQLAYYGQD